MKIWLVSSIIVRTNLIQTLSLSFNIETKARKVTVSVSIFFLNYGSHSWDSNPGHTDPCTRLSRFSQNLWDYLFTPCIPLYGQFWTQNDKTLFKRKCFGVAPFFLKKCEKYKGFSKSIKGTFVRCACQLFNSKNICYPKMNKQFELLRSRRFFRHQYNLCHMRHLSSNVILCQITQNMMLVN